MDLKEYVRVIPDFPKPGIRFKDITPILQHAPAFQYVISSLTAHSKSLGAEYIVGIESRGFIFGAPIADRLKLPFVPIRKPGKLPAGKMSIEYELEYGTGQLDIHIDALPRGANVLIVDDLLATGGTAKASAELVEILGGKVLGFAFVIELSFLSGREKLAGYPVHSLLTY